MKLTEKKQRWVPHDEVLPQSGGAGVTRRILAYNDGLMCVENTFEKGAVGALHSHPHTQITYVVSGTFAFTIDGETPAWRQGCCWISSPPCGRTLYKTIRLHEKGGALWACRSFFMFR